MPFKASDRQGYYGWRIALTLAITETISWGIIYYAFSVFITAMETDLHASRTEITGAFSLALLVTGAMAFPVGNWIDRHGARSLMTTGSAIASVLVVASSQVQSLPALYLVWIGLGVCGATVLYEPAFAVLATWFVRERGRALAIVTFAAGLASTIFIPLSNALLQAFGWRTGILLLGLLLASVTVPLHAVVLRRRPHDLGLLPDGNPTDTPPAITMRPALNLRQALRSASFWRLTAVFGFAALGSTAVRFHFIPLLLNRGVDANTAALASGSIGIMQVAGRVIFAPLDRRFSIHVMIMGVLALEAVAMLALLLSDAGGAVVFFVVIFGSAYGAQTLTRPSILAELYGTTHYGRISSIMAIFLTVAGTIAPVGASWMYEHFSSYQSVIAVSLLIFVIALLIMTWMKPDAHSDPLLDVATPTSEAINA